MSNSQPEMNEKTWATKLAKLKIKLEYIEKLIDAETNPQKKKRLNRKKQNIEARITEANFYTLPEEQRPTADKLTLKVKRMRNAMVTISISLSAVIIISAIWLIIVYSDAFMFQSMYNSEHMKYWQLYQELSIEEDKSQILNKDYYIVVRKELKDEVYTNASPSPEPVSKPDPEKNLSNDKKKELSYEYFYHTFDCDLWREEYYNSTDRYIRIYDQEAMFPERASFKPCPHCH